MTFIAALRYDRISAPWVIDGPITGELFTLYVEKVLAPTLGATSSSSIISAVTRAACTPRHPRHGGMLFLPPTARPQSDRAGLRQTQTLHSCSRATRRRGNLAKVGELLDLFHGGVRQLLQKLRICFRIKTSCTRNRKPRIAPGLFIAEQRYCRGLNRSRSTARKIRQCAHRAQWCLSISAFFARTKTRADHLTSRCGCVNASCSQSGPLRGGRGGRGAEARRVASARLAGLIGQRCRSKASAPPSPASRRRSRRAPRR
jgi:hypothetical protein